MSTSSKTKLSEEVSYKKDKEVRKMVRPRGTDSAEVIQVIPFIIR